MKSLILLVFAIGITLMAAGQDQPTESQLAVQYFKSKEFDKAADLYQKLYKSTNSKNHLDYYLQCLLELKDYETAEKLLKKQLKKTESEPEYAVFLGYIYKLQDKQDKMTATFMDILKQLPDNQYIVITTANSFFNKRLFDWAEKTYLEARKKYKSNTYHYELANLYAYQSNFSKMLDELLESIDEIPETLADAQYLLQNYISQDNTGDISKILRTGILRKIQAFPTKTIYSDLLIWLYIQSKDFDKALVQAKALDKRNKENGFRLMQIAELSLSNQGYSIAIEALQIVIDKGSLNENYIEARLNLLQTYYQKTINEGVAGNAEIAKLEADYLSTINNLGLSPQTIRLITDLAHLQGFYLNKAEAGINLLNEALKVKGLNFQQISECKLELADIQLLSGDNWEATLTYAQVEKSNENTPLGSEARFRKAKLAYFTGNFQWAQAQLDVLKASTSKLIANDAMDLSLLISENIGQDSNEVPLQRFARADLLLLQNKDSLAMQTLDSILKLHLHHELTDNVYFKKSQIMDKQKKYNLEIEFLQKILTEYPTDLLADKATYKMAQLYENKLNDKLKAQEYYKDILLKYPSSILVSDARKSFRRLRGDVQ